MIHVVETTQAIRCSGCGTKTGGRKGETAYVVRNAATDLARLCEDCTVELARDLGRLTGLS